MVSAGNIRVRAHSYHAFHFPSRVEDRAGVFNGSVQSCLLLATVSTSVRGFVCLRFVFTLISVMGRTRVFFELVPVCFQVWVFGCALVVAC